MGTTGGPAVRALQTPRAAGAAGIIFGLLLGIAIILIRIALAAQPSDATTWLADASRRQALQAALQLLPFAAISFLWFMGAIRDYVGAAEDRFFATVFLGSGLLFVAMLLIVAATASSLLATTDVSQTAPQLQVWEYARNFTFSLLSSYAMRMAAVFTISTTTIGRRLGIFPRWLAWLGYLVALVLLFIVSSIAWTELVFPVWVLLVGGYIFRTTFRAWHAP